jgi:hypothetical protein
VDMGLEEMRKLMWPNNGVKKEDLSDTFNRVLSDAFFGKFEEAAVQRISKHFNSVFQN